MHRQEGACDSSDEILLFVRPALRGTMGGVGAEILAVVAALLYAAGADLQQAEASQDGDLRRLLGRPRWFLGIAINGLGLACQAAALRFGPLLSVQPLLVLSVVFCVPLAARRTRVTWRDGASAVLVVLGLWLLVSAVQPGRAIADASRWGSAVGGVVLGTLLCLVLARGPAEASLLGVAAGLLCGLGATLLKATMDLTGGGLLGVLTTGPAYGSALSTMAGFLLLQRAFQRGPLVASFPALIAVDPLVSAGLGCWLYGERLSSVWVGGLGAAITLLGLALLTTSPAIARERFGATSADCR